ncbi:META domain-containing protein [Deinococcus arenicola]|uniref:META domain-containing protein n=1 Tax=Deinococcus arenicola TaxID=2994950 RepID=A0ABU4DNZ1_9DEIO|nr:META domain-containing protein [Deinococcus sp. ZS9-10]MDV6374148.1 META domain-containing protein [Deinococcus sp. ZS9-10]
MKHLTLILTAALGLSALAAAQNAAPTTDGTWTLTSLTDKQQGTSAVTGTDIPTLSVQGEQMSGSAGCNTFTTSGGLTGQTFRFGPLATTRKLCEPAQNALETRYLNVLAQARAFVLRGDTLTLTSGMSKAVFKMKSKVGGTVNTRLNATWRLVGAQGEEPLTLTFGADGRVNGNTGCNLFMGEYRVTDAGLSFGALGMTRRACAEEALGKQEQTFVQDLSEVTGYEVAGSTLKLTTTSGKVLELARPVN